MEGKRHTRHVNEDSDYDYDADAGSDYDDDDGGARRRHHRKAGGGRAGGVAAGGVSKQRGAGAGGGTRVLHRWTPEEHARLEGLIAVWGTERNWAQIAEGMRGRTGKQCRERWLNHMREGIIK